jgi:hypothetical protein
VLRTILGMGEKSAGAVEVDARLVDETRCRIVLVGKGNKRKGAWVVRR